MTYVEKANDWNINEKLLSEGVGLLNGDDAKRFKLTSTYHKKCS